MIRPFRYLEPKGLEEALDLLTRFGEDARPMAGGTALVMLMKEGLVAPGVVVNLKRIPGWDYIEQNQAGLRIGALTTHRQVERYPFKGALGVLNEMEYNLANVRVRNVATIGGSLAFGECQSDLPPVLAALGASVIITGPRGERSYPVEEFVVDYYQTVTEPGELVREVLIPGLAGRWGASYVKFTPRSPADKPSVGAACAITIDGATGRCLGARLVLGAVAPKVIRVREGEEVLTGEHLSEALLEAVADAARRSCSPISDLYGSGEYKREMAGVILKRAVARAWERARSGG